MQNTQDNTAAKQGGKDVTAVQRLKILQKHSNNEILKDKDN